MDPKRCTNRIFVWPFCSSRFLYAFPAFSHTGVGVHKMFKSFGKMMGSSKKGKSKSADGEDYANEDGSIADGTNYGRSRAKDAASLSAENGGGIPESC